MSANDGENIYNKVVVQGTGPDGSPLSVARYAGQQPAASAYTVTVASPSFSNPSFDVNTTGWANAGAITRDTTAGDFTSTPASGKLALPVQATTQFVGTFLAGRTYLISLDVKGTFSGGNSSLWLGKAADTGDIQIERFLIPDSAFHTFSITYTPGTDTTGVWFTINSPVQVWIDSARIAIVTPTIPDKRGFVRAALLPVQSSITAVEGQQIADTFLSGHMTTPLAGTLVVDAPGGARNYLTGQRYHPVELGPLTGELVNFSHLIDPDSGGIGRTGRIVSVSYDAVSETATVQIDTDIGRQEALLARLAVVTGAALGT